MADQTPTVWAMIPEDIRADISDNFPAILIDVNGTTVFQSISLGKNLLGTYKFDTKPENSEKATKQMLQAYISGKHANERLHYVLRIAKSEECARKSLDVADSYKRTQQDREMSQTWMEHKLAAIRADEAAFMYAIASLNPRYVHVA